MALRFGGPYGLGVLASLTLWLVIPEAKARPSYAVRHNVVHCSACHVSPSGGGMRNLYGKAYGARRHTMPAGLLNESYQVDFRALAFLPGREVDENKTGLGLMSSIFAVSGPAGDSDAAKFVASYDLGVFRPGLREAYVRWRRGARQFLFGRFIPPFGILTDEHRTYTRIQYKTGYNDFAMGVWLSLQPSYDFHYDFALVNGFQTSPGEASGQLSSGLNAGAYVNFRWNVPRYPGFWQLSASYHRRHSGLPNPSSWALATALALDRVTNRRMNGTLLVEYQMADNWNNSRADDGSGPNINPELTRMMVSTANPIGQAYLNQVANATSDGWYLEWNWEVSRLWTMIYKFDRLVLDRRYQGDHFNRYGLGFRYFPAPNMNITARAEWAEVGRSDVPSASLSRQDTYWLVFHLWF